MSKIIWTPVAESNLDDILYHFAFRERRVEVGLQLLSEMRQVVSQVVGKAFPGHRHPLAPAGWLYVQHKRWLIFYRYLGEDVEVVRVIDGVRNLPAQLRDEGAN